MDDDFDLIGPLSARRVKPPGISGEAAAQTAMVDAALERRAAANRLFGKGLAETAQDYVVGEELRTAVNVALRLGRPLLLSGDPGTGKTQAAYWLAQVLGLGDVLAFHVTSESRAQDLLYHFDAGSWFRATQVAALRQVEGEVPKERFLHAGPLGLAFGWDGTPERPRAVLIDEVDKATRDFPNDLLWELDQMRFTVAETGRELACPPDRRPVVIITSNEERRLPAPFLRRCVQHRIVLDDLTIARILGVRLRDTLGTGNGAAEAKLVEAGVRFWTRLGQRRHGLSRAYTIDEFWRSLALDARHWPGKLELLADALDQGALKELVTLRTLFPEGDLEKLRDT